jgi:thiol-disulfide isomerase/thioredoxin
MFILIILLIIIIIIYKFWYNNIENFDKTKSKIIIYNFNTTWCGWSKKFQPEWNIFMNKVKEDKSLNLNIISNNQRDVEAIDVKCDDKNELCKKYNVPGYPYVLILKDDKQIEYKNGRTSNELISYVLTL